MLRTLSAMLRDEARTRSEILARQSIEIPGCERYLRLLPHLHDTDGFFAAVMQRAA